jgi:hypothetical protein
MPVQRERGRTDSKHLECERLLPTSQLLEILRSKVKEWRRTKLEENNPMLCYLFLISTFYSFGVLLFYRLSEKLRYCAMNSHAEGNK